MPSKDAHERERKRMGKPRVKPVSWTDGDTADAGQWWADGPEPCSVWVVNYGRTIEVETIEGTACVRDFVLVFKTGLGKFTTDQAAAARSRKSVESLQTAELF